MQNPLSDKALRKQVERDFVRHREARQRAEEIVRDRGWTEEDDDFDIQVDEEAKVQWSEDYDREVQEERMEELMRIIEELSSPSPDSVSPTDCTTPHA